MKLRTRRFVRNIAAVVAVFAVMAFAVPASAATWRFETLDGDGPPGDANGRTTNAAGLRNSTVVWNGTPHVWYFDDTANDLRHAWWTGTTWRFETLDGDVAVGGRTTNEVGTFTSVVVWRNEPHVFYYENGASTASGRNLRHAWWNGVVWNYETLDGTSTTNNRTNNDVGFYVESAVWNGTPHTWYLDATSGHLRHAWWTGSAWNFEVLDGDCTPGPTCASGRISNDVGQHVAAVVWDGAPHVWYRDFTNGDLRHAWWTGAVWNYETLDGREAVGGRVNDDVGAHAAVAVWNGTPHVWYFHDGVVNDLRHAWWTGSVWNFESLDGNCPTPSCADGRTQTDVGRHNAVGVWNGTPHVWYQDLGLGELRHAWWTGTAWNYEKLDGHSTADGRVNADVGYDGAVTVWNDQPHVWYFDFDNFDLRHAWYG